MNSIILRQLFRGLTLFSEKRFLNNYHTEQAPGEAGTLIVANTHAVKHGTRAHSNQYLECTILESEFHAILLFFLEATAEASRLPNFIEVALVCLQRLPTPDSGRMSLDS